VKSIWLGLAVSGLWVLTGCGGSSPSTQPPAPLLITSGTPPSGTVGLPYGIGGNGGFSLTASGGIQQYSWSWTAPSGSSLPPGLTLNNVGVSGQPTTAGTYNVIVTVTDSQSPPQHASANYSITIAPMVPLTITSGNPPSGSPFAVAGRTYANFCVDPGCASGFSLTASGGIYPRKWNWTGAAGSTTPPGLSIQTKGKCGGGSFSWPSIVCTPTTAGTYKVVITVTDSASPPNQVSANYTITIVNPPPPSIATFPPPKGAAINLPYSFTFTENGGLYPLSWSVTGALPPGLSLVPKGSVADLLGTPTASGAFPITVMITDAAGQTATPQNFTILVAAHGFQFTGLMTANRLYSDAALLQDGRVLVTGGLDHNAGVLSSADLYDPATRTFSATGKMAATRSCHTATSLKDGRVLVAGGFDGNGGELATAEIFDPAKGTFVATGSMAAPRVCQTATLLKDGRVLILGGLHNGPLATAELFDPANGSFSSTASPMASAHAFHTATILADGRVLVTGGMAQQSNFGGPIHGGVTSSELFDPATGLFSSTGDMGTARLGHTATLLPNGNVLIAGGSVTVGAGSALATAEIFDQASQTFANTGNMGVARTFHTATPLNDGTVLLAGGDPNDILNLGPISNGWVPAPLASAELFDPASGMFTETGGLVNGRENHTAILLKDGTVLVIGGFWYLNEAETYQ
jgi:putative Ig domain-containing protein/galactose oxidase-like protein